MRTPKFRISSLDLHLRTQNVYLYLLPYQLPLDVSKCLPFNLPPNNSDILPTDLLPLRSSQAQLVAILFSWLRENLFVLSLESTYPWGHPCDHRGQPSWTGQSDCDSPSLSPHGSTSGFLRPWLRQNS